MEQSSSQELSNHLEPTFLPFLQSFKHFRLILHSLSVSFLSLYNVSELETTFAALSFSTQAILMERVATHEVD